MVIDHKSPNHEDIRPRLYETVVQGKVSSLEMLCNLTGIEEELVRESIEYMVEDGSLEGKFTDDGKRFFLSNVQPSKAPIAATHDSGPDFKRADTKSAKFITISGIALMIVGQILRSLVAVHPGMDNAGIAIFMLGIGVLIAGWYQFSRLNPPTKLR